ncbi:MAG: hypothetical protein LBL36_01750 [Clostridiales Family XIII bacterium]|jgi:hypothetical protein|nr:hypothetical protein [Clostridiales Family XIII bacterium]
MNKEVRECEPRLKTPSSGNMDVREEFREGLRLIIKRSYSPESAAKYAFDFYLKHKISDKDLCNTVEDIMLMDAGPEFEMKELVKEELKLKVD